MEISKQPQRPAILALLDQQTENRVRLAAVQAVMAAASAFEVAPRAGQEGIEELDERRLHQLVAVAGCGVQQAAAQFLNVPGLGRQNIGDLIRQDPGGHGHRGGC